MVETMLEEMQDYYQILAGRHRLILLSLDDQQLYCTFFVLYSPGQLEDYYRKPCWDTPTDEADGPIVYLDKLLAPYMNRSVWETIHAQLTQRVPSWVVAVWYRYCPRQDRDVRHTFRRRR